MKNFIFTFLAVSALCSLQASQGDKYHVDTGGCVTVGAQKKINTKDFDIQCKSYNSARKPNSAEITGTDPRQMKSNSIFSW